MRRGRRRLLSLVVFVKKKKRKEDMSAVGGYLSRVVGVRFEEKEKRGGGLRWDGVGRYIPIMRQEVQSKS